MICYPIKFTVLKNSKYGHVAVSTVKLPEWCLAPGETAFETMVFPSDEDGEFDPGTAIARRNYNSREEARAGHKNVVKEWTEWK